MRILPVLILMAMPVAAIAEAVERPQPQTTLELVSDVDALVPGKTTTVALRIVHEAGWHTYWKNPGTVGLATSIEWTLPDGYTAGPIRWAQPQLTKMAAYTVWGYEGEALLLTDITVPSSAKIGESVTLRASVMYMACAKACCPDEKKLAITMPLRKVAKPIADLPAQFEAVRRQQPRAIDGWSATAKRTGETYTLTLAAPAGASVDETTLYFFNDDRLVSSDAEQAVQRDGDRIVMTLRREEHTPGDLDRLRGHVYCPGGFGGDATALAIDVPTTR